jgi:hypothetical protein
MHLREYSALKYSIFNALLLRQNKQFV